MVGLAGFFAVLAVEGETLTLGYVIEFLPNALVDNLAWCLMLDCGQNLCPHLHGILQRSQVPAMVLPLANRHED